MRGCRKVSNAKETQPHATETHSGDTGQLSRGRAVSWRTQRTRVGSVACDGPSRAWRRVSQRADEGVKIMTPALALAPKFKECSLRKLCHDVRRTHRPRAKHIIPWTLHALLQPDHVHRDLHDRSKQGERAAPLGAECHAAIDHLAAWRMVSNAGQAVVFPNFRVGTMLGGAGPNEPSDEFEMHDCRIPISLHVGLSRQPTGACTCAARGLCMTALWCATMSTESRAQQSGTPTTCSTGRCRGPNRAEPRGFQAGSMRGGEPTLADV